MPKQLQKCCREVELAIESNQSHAEADIALHNFIAQCSKNRVIYNLMEIIGTGIRVFITLTGNKLTNLTIDSHREIVKSILEGDSVGARCAMQVHLTYNRQAICRKMQEVERDSMDK